MRHHESSCQISMCPNSWCTCCIALVLLRIYPARSAVIGSRLFGFKRNTTLFCGVREYISPNHLSSPWNCHPFSPFSQWCFSRVFFHKGSCIRVLTQILLSSFFFYTHLSQAFKDTALAQLRAEEARQQLTPPSNPEILPNPPQNH